MSTSTESSTDTRSTSRSRAQDRGVRQLTTSARSTEAAVVELVDGTVTSIRAFLPPVLVRPTEAVDAVFTLSEQLLQAARRISYEIASLAESGLEGAERRAA